MSPRSARSPASAVLRLIDALNRQLLSAAGERGQVELSRVRADTAVVEADIKYPTHSGLLPAATTSFGASRIGYPGEQCCVPGDPWTGVFVI